VPQVNTAEDAQGVVASAKFPPYGLRGQGSAFPGIAHGVDISTYVRTANETVIVCLQIESKQGVENVDAICAVPGVGEYNISLDCMAWWDDSAELTEQDMLFIGPNDLALSILGYVPAEPEFVDAIEKIVAAARKHNKWVGRLSNDGASCKRHLEVFDAVALSYDIRAMQNWYMAELGVARL
jgi:4-hydroxy-2-oxoheptanedioate aldolase